MRRSPAVIAFLGGCYIQGGLGVAPGQATLHGSIGLIAQLGSVGSVRAGAGGGLGPYHGDGEVGTISTVPVSIGGEAAVMTSGRRSLVIDADLQPPVTGRLHTQNFEVSEEARTMRGFVGVGYHHVWSQARGSTPSRPVVAITTSLGPELWYTRSDYHASSTQIGGAFSVVLEMRATLIGEIFDCLSSKNGCDGP